MAKRLLVTGSRKWTNPTAIEAALSTILTQWGNPEDAILICGGAEGADTMAERFWRSKGLPVESHPVTSEEWELYGKAAGPIRNGRMVDSGADLCVGFIHGEARGTRDCIRQARKARIAVVEVYG